MAAMMPELVVGHGCNDANLVIPILAGRVPVKFMLVQVCCIFQTLINNKNRSFNIAVMIF